ncbi:MAG: glutamate 5-kinase [Bacteroidetes bacterium]|jgi:glutamate 5-kinase|nr:glutamate 5-kinase [Bacteroidota bacterium]
MVLNRNNRIVVRIEIETLFDEQGRLSHTKMDRLAMILSNLHNGGKEILLVSSGAIALGSEKLGIPVQNNSMSLMQAAAAIGQAELIKVYQKYFDEYHQTVAQVLITNRVMDNPVRMNNAKNTFNTLLGMGIIPIINENDVVSTHDIELDDNYPLALNVASLAGANVILIKTAEIEKYLVVEKGKEKAQLINSEEELFEELETICNQAVSDIPDDAGFPLSIPELI